MNVYTAFDGDLMVVKIVTPRDGAGNGDSQW